MFTDTMKNRYVYLNSMKNIVWEEPLEKPERPNLTVMLHPDLEPVFDRLMRDRPTWRFKSYELIHAGGDVAVTKHATRFKIYDGDEELGQLWRETHWSSQETRYCFNNFRLHKERQRNSVSYTTKPDIAAKRIVKAFHMKTPSERAVDAQEAVRGIAGSIVQEAAWPVRKAKSVIEQEFYTYAVTHWDEVKHMLGDKADKIDLPSLAQTHNEAMLLQEAVSHGNGVNVQLEPNGTYATSRPTNTGYDTHSYTDATLPDHIRGALGLLKLVEDKTSIDGVGLRVSATLYYVMDKKEEPEQLP
jgi:hypothetical protein